jgi:predicted porin
MKRACLIFLMTVGLSGLAQAADLPTKKAVEAPAAKSNCWASLWTYLNSSADDCPLSYAGITLYGTLDVGLGYQEWGAGRSPSADKVNYGIKRESHEHIWMGTYNGLSTSVLGLKMKEDLWGSGWSLIGVVEAGIQPYSGMFLNPPRSLADNNLRPSNTFPFQTANFDSSRNGSWDNSQGFVGVSNKTYGTLTFGRTNSLTYDNLSKYDPIGAIAFSLIAFSNAFPGFGDTELVRPNTVFTYRLAYNNFRVAGQAQVGGFNWQNGSQAAYYGQLGADFGDLSLDGIVGWAKDAVSLATFGGANNSFLNGQEFVKVNGINYDPNRVLRATLSNNFGFELMASYKWDRFKFYGGYIYANLSNPSDNYTFGFRTIYPEIFVPAGAVTSNNFNIHRELQTVWTGVRWSVWDNLDLAAAFYYQDQNNFNFTVNKQGFTVGAACTGSGITISSSKCAGSQDALSIFADWRPVKRVDVYAGVMLSNVYGGLANGFLHAQSYDPTVGVRVRF